MPSSYTPNLRLEKQATGENSATWGDKRNAGIDQTEAAICGVAALNMTGTGDYTLTTQNGATDEARNMILSCTGTLTEDRQIVVPGVSKLYVVSNATSGAFDLTIGLSGQANPPVIRQGSSQLVYCSGGSGAVVYLGPAIDLLNGFNFLTTVSMFANPIINTGAPLLQFTDSDDSTIIKLKVNHSNYDFSILKTASNTEQLVVHNQNVYAGPVSDGRRLVDRTEFNVTNNSYKIQGSSTRYTQWDTETVAPNSSLVVNFHQEFTGTSNISVVVGIQDTPVGSTVNAPTAIVLQNTTYIVIVYYFQKISTIVPVAYM